MADGTIFEDIGDGKFIIMVEDANTHGIMVEFGQRAPANPLSDPYAHCLSVAMYA